MIWFDSSSIFWVDRVAPVKKRWTLKALAEWALTFGRSALAAGIYIHEANWWHNEERTHEPTDFEPRDLGSIFLWFTNTKDADRSKNRLWDKIKITDKYSYVTDQIEWFLWILWVSCSCDWWIQVEKCHFSSCQWGSRIFQIGPQRANMTADRLVVYRMCDV